MVVSPNEDSIFTALRAFLLKVLPDGTPVVQSQANRVAEPVSVDYVLMTPLRIPRLSTDKESLGSLGLAASFVQSVMFVIQLDVHGPAASDNSSIISTMFRSSYAVDFFSATYPAIAPLFSEDPRQMPFTSGEQQYENRYVIEMNLQVNQTVSVDTTSATALGLGIIEVETNPDSWPNSVALAP